MRFCPHVHGMVLFVALLSACAPTRPRQPIGPEMRGTYRFDERLSDDTRITGRFTVAADTVEMDADPGPCRYEREQSNSSYFSYKCGMNVIFRFDRSDPVGHARYDTVVQVEASRTVCRRYTTTSTGQTVCAEYGKETYYRNESRSGVLRVTRVSDAM